MKAKIILLNISLALMTNLSAQILPYQNPKLSSEERAEDLLGRLTLEEKSRLMRNGSPGIPRLGIPPFDWWSEALHGVGRNGLSTVFPSCIGMACSFNDDLIERIFTAVSDEARAKNTLARQEDKAGKYSCLSFWTPTINIFRDPRWGRGQESYGEDPFMNAQMGLRVVKGLQGIISFMRVPNILPFIAVPRNFVIDSISRIYPCATYGKHIYLHSRH